MPMVMEECRVEPVELLDCGPCFFWLQLSKLLTHSIAKKSWVALKVKFFVIIVTLLFYWLPSSSLGICTTTFHWLSNDHIGKL